MPDPPNSHDFVYVHTVIPPGMTIREWRAERAARSSATHSAELDASVRRLAKMTSSFVTVTPATRDTPLR